MRDRGRENHVTVAVSLAMLLAAMAASTASAELPPPAITGRAAVVLDGTTGRVIWERDADRQMPPASTTQDIDATDVIWAFFAAHARP